MTYTVKQLAMLAKVSPRTLHYYDETRLLKPESVGLNGYRHYGEASLLRLQQILFFKELGLELDAIKQILDQPGFDQAAALAEHKSQLIQQRGRIDRLIQTVDRTILHLKGQTKMESNELFEGFSDEKQKEYEQEIREKYGDKAFEGVTDWNSYTKVQQERIKGEGKAIYADLVKVIDQGPDSPEVQAIIARWHQHLRYFYEPSDERLLGLGKMYTEHPGFIANFTRLHPRLPEFMYEAIKVYVKNKQAK